MVFRRFVDTGHEIRDARTNLAIEMAVQTVFRLIPGHRTVR